MLKKYWIRSGMLNNFFKIILIILSVSTTGCAVLLSPLSSKEFDLYTTNRFEELNNYLKKSGGTLSDNARQRILNENINKIRMNQNTTLEFVRYQVNKKYYIETLMEMGEFTKALSYCDETLKEFYMISDLLSKCNYQHEVTIDNNSSLIYDLLHLKGYLVWFISKTGDKKLTLEKFKEATRYVSSISKRNMFDSEIQQKLIFLFDDAMFYEKIIGDYKKALEIYKKVIKLTETLGFTSIDMKYGSYMQTYQRMMNLYIKLGELQKAQEILEEYQKLTDTSIFKTGDFVIHQIPRWRENLAILYTDYGVLYSRLQENSKSKEYFDKAFNIVKEIDPQTKNGIEREALGRYYILYGTYYVGHVLWKYDEAQKYIDQGLGFLKSDYYTRIRDQFDLETAYLFSGEIHFLNKDYDNALKYAENAITYSTKIHNNINVARAYTLIGKIWNERKEYKKAKNAFQIANEIITKEKVESTENYELFYSMGQMYEGRDANLSLKYYKKAVDEVEKLWRGRFNNTQKQVSFIDNRLVVFEPVIRILVRKGIIEEAVDYMERSKSRTLSDDVQYYSVTENVNVKDKDISNTISYRQIKDLVSDKTAFLEYYIGKESVIAAIITNKGVHFKELQTTPKKLIEDITAFRLAIEDPRYPYQKWGLGLYSILITPFSKYLSGYESICIIPHGVLHNLPFML